MYCTGLMEVFGFFRLQEDEAEEQSTQERRIERTEPVGRADSSLDHSPFLSFEWVSFQICLLVYNYKLF